MRKTIPNLLLSLLVLCSGFAFAQTFYVWTDVDPVWEKNSLAHWESVKGFSDNQKENLVTKIKEQNTLLRKNIGFKFYELLKGEERLKPELVENPLVLRLTKEDLYGELTPSLKLTHEKFPFFHGNSFFGMVSVQYDLTVYNSVGDKINEYEAISEVDLKKIKKDISSRSNSEVDIEAFSMLFNQTAAQSLNQLNSDLSNDVSEGKFIVPSEYEPKLFTKSIAHLFEQRRTNFPSHYSFIQSGISAAATSEIGRAVEGSGNINYAAFNDPEIAEKIGESLAQVKNYALVIGINQYEDPSMVDLDNPIDDAELLKSTLTSYYTFEDRNMVLLKDAQREDIINALDHFAEIITEKDNFLVFYAGHGLWDERLKTGYWLPADAKKDSRSDWFSNNDLVGYIGGIRSKHTLLIADACFSGGIFKTREAFTGVTSATLELYKMPSRKAMTSGTMATVPDKSVFIEYLVKRLVENTQPFLSSEELFSSFKSAVINNSPNNQVPQFGDIRETGDEGGDFIFVRK